MILFFELIVIGIIWCLGIKIVTAEGMVLEKLGKWGQQKVDEGHKILEPLFVCHFCMPSIHTLFSFYFAFALGLVDEFRWEYVLIYPLVAMGTSLSNGLIWGFHQKQNAEKEFYESAKITAEMMADDIAGVYDTSADDLYEKFNN